MPRLRSLALVLLGVGVAACTDWGPGPDITGGTSGAVTIRYDSGKVQVGKVDAVANAYCAGQGKDAKLRARFGNDPAMTYADYSCIPAATGK